MGDLGGYPGSFSAAFFLFFVVLFTRIKGKWSLAKVQALSGREFLDFLVKRGVFPWDKVDFLQGVKTPCPPPLGQNRFFAGG